MAAARREKGGGSEFNATQKEFAKILGVTQQRVSKYIADKKLEGAYIKKGRRTLINTERALELLGRNLDPAGSPPEGKKKRLKVDDEKKREVADSAGTGGLSYQTARTLNEQYKAALNKLEYEKKSGKLVDVETLERLFFDAGRKVRDQLLAIPDRCAALVAAAYGGDQHECREILKKEITNVCSEIAKSAKEVYQ